MASFLKLKSGLTQVKFNRDGRDCRIRLGRIDRREGSRIASHITAILRADVRGEALPNTTADWIDSLDPKLRRKLEKYGLLSQKPATPQWLKPFLELCLERKRRRGVKEQSMTVYKQSADNLLTYFGNCRVDSIDGDAVHEFRAWLETEANKRGGGLAAASVGKRLKTCRAWFHEAERLLHIENPFAVLGNLDQAATGAAERKVYIGAEIVHRMIEDAPDNEWRLLLALWRFAGLRQTEPLSLRWDDISWDTNRMTVTAEKQAERSPKRLRVIPIWPEVQPWLERQFDNAKAGTPWVITRRRYNWDTDKASRSTASNLYTTLQRQCVRLGIQPWPRLTHNLRASGETDAMLRFEAWEVAYWWNHSVRVQQQHYLQVREEAYDRAAIKPLIPVAKDKD